MTDLAELSEEELKEMMDNAAKALKQKQESKKKEVMAQIRQMAASIGMSVSFHEAGKESSRKGIKVPPKYRNPANPEQTWTGRGVAPKWMQELIAAGHDKSEFEIQ